MSVVAVAFGLFLLLFFGLVVVGFIWWLVVLMEALRIPDPVWERSGQNKIVYVALMVLLGLIGSLVYVLVARPPLRAAGANISGGK